MKKRFADPSQIADKISLVHVLGRLDVGGAEKMLLTLCASMPSDRFSQTIITLSGKSGYLSKEFESCGVQEIRCKAEMNPRFVTKFARTLALVKTDVLISHVSMASGALLLIAWVVRVPRRIAVFHSDGDGRQLTSRRRLYVWLMRRALSFAATNIVGVTETTLAFSGLSGKRSQVISTGIDLEKFQATSRGDARARLGLEVNGRVLGHAGRAAPEKNRKALPAIISTCPEPSILVLAGAVTDQDLALSPTSVLRQRIVNLGILDDMPSFYASLDVFVLPSIREGLPLVILEAIASGCPVVATGLAGIQAVARKLPDVVLVPIGAPASDFVAAIETAVKNRRTAEEMRQSLRDAKMDLGASLERWVVLCDPN